MQNACLTMAGASASTSFRSFGRQHHEYYRSWTPVTGELFPFKREISSDHDPFTVMIWKDGEVVGDVPQSMSKITSRFLDYDGNVVFYEITVRSMTGNGSSLCFITSFMDADLTLTNWKNFLEKVKLYIKHWPYYRVQLPTQKCVWGHDWVAIIRNVEVTALWVT